ncbi:MAG: CatB-related O-acetyltransferase [Sphingomonadales bacterium]|nr:CatB-related O-acetyltransferase [Sphingomonadales bacterium]
MPAPKPFPAPTERHPVLTLDGTPHEETVFLKSVIAHPNITVGDYSYTTDFSGNRDYAALLAPYLYPGAPERLEIGKFCSIAHGVRFITASSMHPMGGVSTYPFRIFSRDDISAYREECAGRGDTVVGHDVWLGFEARVMPGVRIGHGAIVAACAVVSRDVPDYAIVAGNPARVVRMRFDPETVARLLALAWWDWPIAAIQAALPAIEAGDLAALAACAPATCELAANPS